MQLIVQKQHRSRLGPTFVQVECGMTGITICHLGAKGQVRERPGQRITVATAGKCQVAKGSNFLKRLLCSLRDKRAEQVTSLLDDMLT